MRNKALAGFSGGMRQRFGIAQALIGNPQLIIVDEPTAGLDPEERNRFLNLLAEIGENVVVILSTHIVEDVADLCPRMAIIADGRIVRDGRAARPRSRELRGRIWHKTIDKHELEAYRASHEVISTRLFGGRTVIHVLADRPPGDGFDLGRGRSRGRLLLDARRRCAARPEARMSMFRAIAAFELRYQLKSPVFWVTASDLPADVRGGRLGQRPHRLGRQRAAATRRTRSRRPAWS